MNRHKLKLKVLLVLVLLGLLAPVLSTSRLARAAPATSPATPHLYCIISILCADVDVTLGDLKGAIEALQKLIDEEIPKAGAEVRRLLGDMRTQLNGFLKDLDETFKGDLKLLISSINAQMQTIVVQARTLLKQGFTYMAQLIEKGEDAVRGLLTEFVARIHSLIADFEEAAKRILVFAVEGAVIIIDHSVFELYGLISFILLAVELILVLWGLWYLFIKGAPRLTGNRRPFLYSLIVVLAVVLVGTGSVFFAPPARVWAMRTGSPSAGRQLEVTGRPPLTEIFGAVPATIKINETKEIRVLGYNLRPPDRNAPTVTIGGQEVPITLTTNATLVADVSNLNVPDGPSGLVVTYSGTVTNSNALILDTTVIVKSVESPQVKPDLVVTEFRLEPASPSVNQLVRAFVTVQNRGDGVAGFFSVTWRPDAATAVGPTQPLDGLAPGQSATLAFDQAYPQQGTFGTVAVVDPFNDVAERDETNNLANQSITVGPPPPNPTATPEPIDPPEPTVEPDPCLRRHRPPLYKCNLMPDLPGCDC